MSDTYDFSISDLGARKVPSPIKLSSVPGDFVANYVTDDDRIRYEIDTRSGSMKEPLEKANLIEKAGPRANLFFSPKQVHAAIVTCGGLCPGLNDVIRAIVRCLWNRYGVRRISGIPYGFKGLIAEYGYSPVDLDPEIVDDIHKTGGSFLGTSRGGGDRVMEIVDSVERMNINMLFIIGGDGTQKGSLEIAEEIEKRGMKIAVVGIPKTVDNDLSFIQKSFGFDTAVVKATEAVSAAHMEAHSHINGIFCLIPEVPFDLEGDEGLLHYVEDRIQTRGHSVMVVAEGAGQDLLSGDNGFDASGNKKLGDIGVFLRDKITEYFESKKIHINLKYIDPSYQIRSSPAAAIDSIYCERLGNNAVHAAMAGKTKLLIGLVHNEFVHLPIKLAVAKRNYVDPEGALWRDALDATGQPVLMVNDKAAFVSNSRKKQEGSKK